LIVDLGEEAMACRSSRRFDHHTRRLGRHVFTTEFTHN
jgi:hypothetical protein